MAIYYGQVQWNIMFFWDSVEQLLGASNNKKLF